MLLGRGDGTFSLGAAYTLFGTGPDSLAVGDLNRDGILDLVSTGGTFADVFLGDGDGTLGSDMSFFIAIGGEATRIADMNGDGIPDLVFPSGDTPTTTNIAIVLGAGDGTFGSESFFPSGEEGFFFDVADFNGDHQPDVVVADEQGNAVATLLNTSVVSFSPSTTLTFPQQLVGTTSPAQTVKLTNTGATDLGISSITLSGRGLTMQHTCGQSLPPGGSCKIRVRFRAETVGAVPGTISIVDTASSKPQVIAAMAAGTVVSLSPKALQFGPQKIGTTSAAQDVTVTNHGSQIVKFAGVIINATGFEQTNTCSELSPGASCTVSISFRPDTIGLEFAKVILSDSGGGGQHVIPVQGTGTR
ncbi:MAG: choice-of-anchor D domain-containing protein [Acidobacteriales bacterium]|nr:choice-of-anchor D domain-containing protein [Terriglobales bacterium]